MRSKFHEQLEFLNDELIEMGELVEKSISLSTSILMDRNKEALSEVKKIEESINKKDSEIESLCFDLLLQQQPVAKDLRLISSALKIVTDMERIGDQSLDIAEISKLLIAEKYIKELIDIPKMAIETKAMLKDSIRAFVTKDIELARRVIERDDVVDDLFVLVKNDLIDLIHKDVGNGEQALDLLMIGKYFERIGDHAENIAEWVIFTILGEHD